MNHTRNPRPNRYGEAYNFSDPYPGRASHPQGYEYIGTEEPPSYPGSPRNGYSSMHQPPRQSYPQRRMSRTTSPPHPSMRGRYHAQSSSYERVGSPPRHSRHVSPPPKGRREPPVTKHTGARGKYQDFAQRPGVKRAQTYGMKGLNILGDAAAAYVASQGQGGDPRGRSVGRDPYDDYYPEPRRSHRHARRPAYSPSPSPSPPRRRGGRHTDRSRGDKYGRRETFSESPPRSRRDADRHDRDRAHHHDRPRRRASSYSPSPAPRNRDHRRSMDAGAGAGAGAFIAGLMGSGGGGVGGRGRSGKMPDKAAAAKWQNAAQAALKAGGATALRIRKDPGSWTGDKGAKVATAALGAAAMDAIVGKDSRKSRDRGGGGSGMKSVATSAITGMLAEKLMGAGKSRKSR